MDGMVRRRGLFRLGHRHCFTVDENLICATKRARGWEHGRQRGGGGGGGRVVERDGRERREREGRGVAGKGESGGSDGCCLV